MKPCLKGTLRYAVLDECDMLSRATLENFLSKQESFQCLLEPTFVQQKSPSEGHKNDETACTKSLHQIFLMKQKELAHLPT